jgi:hypothetical protein
LGQPLRSGGCPNLSPEGGQFSNLLENLLDFAPIFTNPFRKPTMDKQRYRFNCTLTFSDIYGQIIVWLAVLFLSLAAALALMGASRPIYALATVGLVLVLSIPFLLFAFVTTLLNHIEFVAVDSSEDRSVQMKSSLQAVR